MKFEKVLTCTCFILPNCTRNHTYTNSAFVVEKSSLPYCFVTQYFCYHSKGFGNYCGGNPPSPPPSSPPPSSPSRLVSPTYSITMSSYSGPLPSPSLSLPLSVRYLLNNHDIFIFRPSPSLPPSPSLLVSATYSITMMSSYSGPLPLPPSLSIPPS